MDLRLKQHFSRCDKDALESCQVKWEGREFSFFSRFAASLRHMSCCNPSRRERKSHLLPALVAAVVASIISRLRLKRGPAFSSHAVPGSKLLSPYQHFVARKAVAAKRNPYLEVGVVCPSLSRTSFRVIVSAAIYFPWSPFYYLLRAAGLAAVWEGCSGGADLGCSSSRHLGRTWCSCASSAGSVPMAHRWREERQWALTAARGSSA